MASGCAGCSIERLAAKPRQNTSAVTMIPYIGSTNGKRICGYFSSIVKDTPMSVTELNPAVPRELGRIVRRALVKDPTRRYQTAADLRDNLEELKASLDSGELQAELAGGPAVVGRRQPRVWAWAALGIAAFANPRRRGAAATSHGIHATAGCRTADPDAPADQHWQREAARHVPGREVRRVYPDRRCAVERMGASDCEQQCGPHRAAGGAEGSDSEPGGDP